AAAPMTTRTLPTLQRRGPEAAPRAAATITTVPVTRHATTACAPASVATPVAKVKRAAYHRAASTSTTTRATAELAGRHVRGAWSAITVPAASETPALDGQRPAP